MFTGDLEVERSRPDPLREPPSPAQLAELERLIRRGAGLQNTPGLSISPAQPSDARVAYELHVEQKHLRLLVPELERFVSLSGREVLDFGCGTGGVAVASRGARVVGVEPTAASVEAATLRARLRGVEARTRFLHQPDTRHLPFADETFDLCVANSVLEYIYEDRAAYVQELWRVLRPGGVLYVGDTSNGLYPCELHSGRLLINYRAGKVRAERCVAGVSFWELERILEGRPHRVLNLERPPGEARAAFLARHRSSSALGLLCGAVLLALEALGHPLGVPLEAWLPWLNLAIAKPSA